MDTGQVLQQLLQVLQASQPENNATRAIRRTQSGISVGKNLGILPQDQPWLNTLSEGVPGIIKSMRASSTVQAPGLPEAWNAVSTQHNLPMSTLASFHQAGMDPTTFTNMMAQNPELGQSLLSMSALTPSLPNLGNLAQVYGAAQATPLMALPADAAALGASSAVPALTGAAGGAAAAEAGAAGAGGLSGILSALGISAL
mgnify:FL=1